MNIPNLANIDTHLKPFANELTAQQVHLTNKLDKICELHGSLKSFASQHEYLGLLRNDSGWVIREWAPNATHLFLIGEFSNWKPDIQYQFLQKDKGIWEIELGASVLKHGDLYKLFIQWEGGEGTRIPSHATRVVQDPFTKIYNAQVWMPETNFRWSDSQFNIQRDTFSPLIYEAHIGMASEEEKVASFNEFRKNILPKIKSLGYNTIQLMAIQEHPYYGSFGYHVSNFFAVSSRFGTPEDLKQLINTAHEFGLAVIMDIVHSHSVKNELEGLALFDGDPSLYFEDKNHPAWDSKCFNYRKNEVLQFLLSNCKYWLEEFHFDGFRFDGVTSMLYHDHGLEKDFNAYADYFGGKTNLHAITYLALANQLIHEIKPYALSIAEEMSAYPGIAGKINDGGIGFDYRLSMGIPDFWIKLIKEKKDEDWKVGQIYHELSQHRIEEQTINYAESHDQALVGDKTIFFRLADKEMYDNMAIDQSSLVIDRAISLHKMIRLISLSTASGGYLNFMGNEFGHPEWIDFPREGNNSSYKYARRQWSLIENDELRFQQLNNFDKAIVTLFSKENIIQNKLIHRFNNDTDQVLAYSRGDYLFVYNFNPEKSFTGYGIPVAPGKHQLILSSDDGKFGGFDRVPMLHTYKSELYQHNKLHQILLYLPARTCIVLKRQAVKRVY